LASGCPASVRSRATATDASVSRLIAFPVLDQDHDPDWLARRVVVVFVWSDLLSDVCAM
jgi:hypothetical protein